MLSDKDLKAKYKSIFWKSPERFYPVETLKSEGYSRKICKSCKKPFWSTYSRDVCMDPSCSKDESFGFIGKPPSKKKLDYIEVWLEFSKMFKKLNYAPINRYPIVARWHPTLEYANASIAAFQPYVITGEIEPPANPLVIPQLCFRTTDIDNVGLTGSHMTVFSMIGQHAFLKPQDWNQNKYFQDIYSWLRKGLSLNKDEIVFHEDAWAGNNNLGPCLEFFSRGCELGNQVYMMYEQVSEGQVSDLKIKVLDMGMGMERNAWFSQGTNTIYDASFPTVIKKLIKETGIKVDSKLIQKYVPYAGLLNVDETPDIENTWKNIASKLKINVQELKENILPLAAIYSIAEHSRALLVMFSDGALPSNTGGGYNLRLLARRTLSFIDKYKWKIDIDDSFASHASYLKKLWPEFNENLEQVKKIFAVEKQKYENTKQKTTQLVTQLLKEKIDERVLLKVYDTHGISPELIQQEALSLGKKINIPENFYVKVSQLHEVKEQLHKTEKEIKLNLDNIPETEVLYYYDTKKHKFTAKIIKQIGKHVILNKTYFYPTSGGQLHDTGYINSSRVIDVFRQGKHIIHVLEKETKLQLNKEVDCEIDFERRWQLSQNHTATHIINAAAKRILGNHVNQASAFKDIDKARIDITHYQALTDLELKKIEKEANHIVSQKIPIYKRFMERNEAEKTYGTSIYQGGVAPGKQLRIVEIAGDIDVEACGGSHLDNTFEAGMIKILGSKKISDSIVRIEFVAGDAASRYLNKEASMLQEVAKLLKVPKSQVPSRARELFEIWKDVVKKKKPRKLEFTSKEEYGGSDRELLEQTARILKTQPEHVVNTIKRFLKELGK